MTNALAYMRTSSHANVGADKDSEPRQRAAITGYAEEAGYNIAADDFFYEPKIKGEDAIMSRPVFIALLERIEASGIRVVIVESPDRFARDLAVQLAGHDYLKKLGVTLIPASAPDYFTEDTPTAVLVRQVLGAIAQFEKASLVAKLHAARKRKAERTGKKCGGPKNYAELNPELVARAVTLRNLPSLRAISAQLASEGYVSKTGTPYAAMSVSRMLQSAVN